MTHLLREAADLSPGEAESATDAILSGSPVEVSVEDPAAAERFVERARALGAICEVGEWSNHCPAAGCLRVHGARMVTSLHEFLRSGELGRLRPGLTREEIVDILGPPDAEGGTSRKYRTPSIFRYGNLEFWFERYRAGTCTGLYMEYPPKGEVEFPAALHVEGWSLVPGASREAVEQYLAEKGIQFSVVDNALLPGLLLETGRVSITFEEDDILYSIYSGRY